MNYNYLTWNNDNYKIKKSLRKEIIENINRDIHKKMDEKINQLNRKNNREECIIKQGNRNNIIQTNINPFLTNNNYIDDINNQEKYLRQKSLKMKL